MSVGLKVQLYTCFFESALCFIQVWDLMSHCFILHAVVFKVLTYFFKKSKNRTVDFPGGPVVRTQRSHCHGLGLVPGQGTEILHDGAKKKRKRDFSGGRGVWGLCSAQLCCEPKAAPKIEIYLTHGKSWCSVIRVVNSGSEGGAGLLLTCPWLPWSRELCVCRCP